MADQTDELKEERARLEKQLESIRAAREKFEKEPEEFSYELAKATKDEAYVQGLLEEVDAKLAASSKE